MDKKNDTEIVDAVLESVNIIAEEVVPVFAKNNISVSVGSTAMIVYSLVNLKNLNLNKEEFLKLCCEMADNIVLEGQLPRPKTGFSGDKKMDKH